MYCDVTIKIHVHYHIYISFFWFCKWENGDRKTAASSVTYSWHVYATCDLVWNICTHLTDKTWFYKHRIQNITPFFACVN